MLPRNHGFRGGLFLALTLAGCGGGGDGGGTPDDPPPVIAGRTYGGVGQDFAWSVLQVADGGFVFAGFTNSRGAGGYDAWVVRTNASGQVLQEQTYGGSGNDFAFSLRPTADGGYLLAGVDGEVSGWSPGSASGLPGDACGELTLRKLNADLSLAWERRVSALSDGVSGYPYALGYAVQPTLDGGCIVAGATGTGVGGGQTLLLKADASGAVSWHAFLAGELGTGVQEASDGGFWVSTLEGSLIRTSSGGLASWTQALGGSALSVCRCGDGTVAVAGQATTNAGDIFVARVALPDGLVWSRTFGSPGGDAGYGIQQTPEGGFIVVGTGGSAALPGRRFDLSLCRLDAAGSTLWEVFFGGTGDEVGRCVGQTADGGYIAAGSTTSQGAGGIDAYLVRTSASGAALW